MWTFQAQTSDISHEKIWTWLKKRNLKKKAESFLTVAQNNTMMMNDVKARIDKMQQNSGCRLCSDRDEKTNDIIREML